MPLSHVEMMKITRECSLNAGRGPANESTEAADFRQGVMADIRKGYAAGYGSELPWDSHDPDDDASGHREPNPAANASAANIDKPTSLSAEDPSPDAIIDQAAAAGVVISDEVRLRVRELVKKKTRSPQTNS